MAEQDSGAIYINVTPKAWRITMSYRAMAALKNLSSFMQLGHVPFGIHDGIGVRTNFVMQILFANVEDKRAYTADERYKFFIKKLKRDSKRNGLVLLTD